MCGPSSPPDADSARHPLIVVLDEDEALREALRFCLETEGYRVSVFGAAEALLGCPDCRSPACFVVDEACQDPKLSQWAQVSGTPVVLLSGRPDRTVPARWGGQAAVVEKPLMTDALSRQIAAALAGAGR
jgi:FixJ family two-component response regulator